MRDGFGFGLDFKDELLRGEEVNVDELSDLVRKAKDMGFGSVSSRWAIVC